MHAPPDRSIAAEPSADTSSTTASIWCTARAAVVARPVVSVLALASALALVHGWWIWTHRRLGAIDPDEAGYLADAFRFKAAVLDGPGALYDEVRAIGTAPLIPLLSVPLLLIGPDDPRTALLVQPVLMVVMAVCITDVARRLVGPATAVGAGVAFLLFPATIHAAQAYHYGLGAGAAMSLAVLALLRSERGTNWWIWVFGAATGAMVLFRTMALGFLPAIGIAALVAIGRDRRGLRRLAMALLVAAAVAAPWYVAARDPIFGYLFQYGYGARSHAYGSAGVLGRVVGVPLDAILSAGVVLPALTIVAAIALAVRSARRRGVRATVRLALAPRDRRALVAALAVGLAALLSTANQGGWFVYPLFSAVVPLGAGVLERSGQVWRRLALGVVAVHGSLLLLTGLWVLPYGAVLPFPSAYETRFSLQDARFDPRRRDEQAAAALEWHEAHEAIVERLREYRSSHGVVFTMSGSTPLLNSNNLTLAARLDGWDARFQVPDTANPDDPWSTSLEPRVVNDTGAGVERMLVIVDPDDSRFPAEANSDELLTEAIRDGWTVTDSFHLPVGAVRIYRHG